MDSNDLFSFLQHEDEVDTDQDADGDADESMEVENTQSSDRKRSGYTVVDSIDTMLIMNLGQEYLRARDWIEKKLSFEREGKFNTFEVR